MSQGHTSHTGTSGSLETMASTLGSLTTKSSSSIFRSGGPQVPHTGGPGDENFNPFNPVTLSSNERGSADYFAATLSSMLGKGPAAPLSDPATTPSSVPKQQGQSAWNLAAPSSSTFLSGAKDSVWALPTSAASSAVATPQRSRVGMPQQMSLDALPPGFSLPLDTASEALNTKSDTGIAPTDFENIQSFRPNKPAIQKSASECFAPRIGSASGVKVNPGVMSDQVQLQLKDAYIVKLQDEIECQNSRLNTLKESQKQLDATGFEIPKNHEQIYECLLTKLQATEKDLTDTKSRLEAVVTAIAMNPSTTQYKHGRYDEQEVAHRIITKLQMLTEENEELSRMLSYGKAKEKDIEIGLLRQQNVELRDRLSKLEKRK